MNPLHREKVLNFASMLVFLAFLAGSVWVARYLGFRLTKVTLFDMVLLSLSCYRISRMLVYEKIFSLIRFYISTNSDKALIGSINNLITCPWCTGVWVALFVFDVYYLVPFGNYLIYILSIAAIASPLVVLSNNLTLRNDILKEQRDDLNRKRLS